MQRVEIDYIENAGNLWVRAKKEMDIAIDRKKDYDEGSSIVLTNVSSQLFCSLFDVEPTDINGFDWWSKLHYNGQIFNVFGEAWSSVVTVTLE